MPFWFSVGWAGLVLWLLQALFANNNKMLTQEQMIANGIQQGISFSGHGSTWWVLFCLIPLMTILAALYAGQWGGQQWLLALVVGVVISGGMHYLYTLAPFPDYMITNGRLNAAGWSHFVLFTGAIAILVLTSIIKVVSF